jgi:hypothetical protein
VAVGITGLLTGALIVWSLYGICQLYAPPPVAAVTAACLVVGTTLLNYSAMEVTMGHGPGAAATAVFVWYWLTTYGSQRIARWIAVGALVGRRVCAARRALPRAA